MHPIIILILTPTRQMLKNPIKPLPPLLTGLALLVLTFIILLEGDKQIEFTLNNFSKEITTLGSGGCVSCQVQLKSTTSGVAANSATGKFFSNERKRQFRGNRIRFPDIRHSTLLNTNVNMSCTKWGVVTTIFNPTTAIVRLSRLLSWCVVIVPDLKTPNNYMEMLHAMISANSTNSNKTHIKGSSFRNKVFYFSIEKQKKWQSVAGPLGTFAKSIPWGHFSRKNLGYLYAIVHGAHFIFDFDDDNQINVDENGFPFEFLPGGDDISQSLIMSLLSCRGAMHLIITQLWALLSTTLGHEDSPWACFKTEAHKGT